MWRLPLTILRQIIIRKIIVTIILVLTYFQCQRSSAKALKREEINYTAFSL